MRNQKSKWADAVLNPLFVSEEVEKSKEQMIEGLKTQEKSAAAIAGNVYSALVYGKNTASPENFYLVVVGDVTVAQVKKALANGLAKWKRNPNSTKQPLAVAKNLDKIEIDVVNVPTAVQSVIKVGNLHTLSKTDKDYFAARIANYVLGGGSLDSRLNMNLREDKAYTYGAYSRLSSGKYAKSFSAGASVRNAVTAGAVKEIIKEMQNIPVISAKDLKNAKAQLKGSFIMALEQPSTIARYAVNKKIYNLPNNYYKNYLKAIDAVTLEDVKKAAKKYILPSKARIFIAGKANDFLPELEKLGYPIHFYDKEANPTSKPEQKKVAADVTVASIAEKYLAEIGGKDKVAKLTSSKTTSTAKVQGMEMKMTTVIANGGKMMTDMVMMGQSMQKMVFNGKEGYIMARGQKMPMPKDAAEKMAKQKFIFPELGFATAKDLKLKGIETIKDEDAYAIVDGSTVYYYSVKTGLKVAQIITQNANGKEMTIPTYFSNYKLVEGVKIPYTVTQEMMGMEVIFNVDTIEFNVAKDEDFK